MSSGIVNFRATIVSESHSISVASRIIESGDPGPSEDIYVNMGMVSEKQFSGAGSTVSPVMFEIRFDNQDAEKVQITFNGITSDMTNGILTTTNSTVGIQLYDENGNILPVNESREYPLYSGTNMIRFSAGLIATHPNVVPGNLAAVAIFTLAYQ
ncbi:fimbrial protein [Enterobacteriaceae bacterium LUAb1]